MSETTVGLSNKNDLLGSLFTRTNKGTYNSNPNITDVNFIQHETGNEDLNNIETIPFQEILGQHITDLTVRNALNSQKLKHPVQVSETPEVVQENIKGVPPPVLYETPVSDMSDSSQKNAKNLDIPTAFKGKHNGLTFLTKKGVVGFEQDFSGEQIVNTIHSTDISPKTFIEYPETAVQNFGPNPSLKNGLADESTHLNIYNPFIHNPDIKNLSASPFSNGELREIDRRQNKQFININSSDFLFHTETPTSLLQNPTVRNPLSNPDNVGLNPPKIPESLEKLDQSIPGTIQEPEFADSDIGDSDINEIHIKELPTAFKSLAQNVSTENRYNIPLPELNNSTKSSERQKENDLLKINSNVSSKHDVLSTPQTNEEWNLFDNPAQKQSISVPTPFDTHLQKTNSKYPFSTDTQTTKDVIQSNATNFQQNTEVFPGRSTTQLSSARDNNDSVSHTFYKSSTAGIEHTHSNIMEQLFQKISLVTHGNRSEIKMHLTPPELGSVKIHFTEENDEIEAKIFVENAEVKAAIENNAHRLKESVAASGMEIQKLEVYIQNDTAYKQKSSENSDTNNPHYQTKSQEGRNEDRPGNENNISNTLQTETTITTSNLIVDYII